MRDWIANVCHRYLVRIELVLGLVDCLCDGQQIMEARSETSIVWMDHQEDWQVGLTAVGPIAQRLEQGTHNALVLGSNPSRPITIIQIQ